MSGSVRTRYQARLPGLRHLRAVAVTGEPCEGGGPLLGACTVPGNGDSRRGAGAGVPL